jgi:hypothetical protein
MAAQQLKPSAQSLASRIKAAEPALVAILMALLLLSGIGAPTLDDRQFSPLAFSRSDAPEYAAVNHDDSDWERIRAYQIADLDGAAWLRWRVPAEQISPGLPMAVQTIGPFSAEIYFNGELIGQKGQVVEDDRAEQAGPIDSLTAIPPRLIRPEGNMLAMRLSSTRAGYVPATIVQDLRVAPYRADARRSLRYYALPVLLAGAFAALIAGFVMLARSRKDKRVLWLALSIAALLVADAAEVSRALINYPYDWHQPRQMIQLLAMMGFGGGLLAYVVQRWPAPRRWQIAWLAIAILGAIIMASVERGYDAKSAWASFVFLTSSAIWCAWPAWRGDRSALAFVAALSVLPIYSHFWPGDFLDRSVFALAAALFGILLARHRDLLSPPAAKPVSPSRPTLSLQSTGKMVFVPLDEIGFLKAAGNYTEIHRMDGTTALDSRGLSAVLDVLPAHFDRVHRSYAINLDHAETLHTSEGSRYHLSLKGGADVPVGRSMVAALRARMAGG